jgi:uncharacterized protein YecE (DUF72 family)
MIRVGIGGWTYEPWRETFYPAKWPKKRELDYAASKLTAIEINGTFYSSQKPATWADWGRRVPDGFQFAVKASRFCVSRKRLGEGEESIGWFLGQGLAELGSKLGPILWQFAETRAFDPADIAAFLALLPGSVGGVPLRHAIEPRHESFRDPAFFDLARKAGAAVVFADDERHPCFEEQTGAFTYARLQRQREEEPTGYAPAELDGWADRARSWSANGREVFVFMINGAKVRAPHAAMALIARLDQ